MPISTAELPDPKTMSTAELRAEREELTKAGVQLGEKLESGNMNADEHEEFMGIANRIGPVAAEYADRENAHGTMADSKAWLQGLNADPGMLDQGESEQDKLERQSGIKKPRPGMTLGERFTESPAYADYVKRNGGMSSGSMAIIGDAPGRSEPFELGMSMLSESQRIQNSPRMDLIHTGSNIGEDKGNFIQPTVLPMVNEAPLPTDAYLWDLCTRIPVSGGGFKYPRLISQTNNADWVAESTTTADFAVADQTTANGYKPESALDWDQASGTTETIAHFMPVTRQVAAHAPQIVAFIEAFLPRGLRVKAHEGMVNGTGNSPQIRGILNTVNPYTGINVLNVGGGDRFNAILAGMSVVMQARQDFFQPNAILINTTDYFSTEFMGAQNLQGDWRFGGPAQAPGQLSPWGLQPIVTNAIAPGTQLIGDFRWALIADAMATRMFVTDSNRDWFERNLLAILAEMEMGFALMAEDAFVQIDA